MRAAACELTVKPCEVRHLVITEFTEERRRRDARKRIVAALLIVTVGVNQRDAFAEKIIRVLEIAMICVAVVVALRMHHAIGRAESARVALLVASERRTGIPKDVVQI